MKRFLHIAFNWESKPKIGELKPAFNKAHDWARYAPNCWIVWTSASPEAWYERLKPYLDGKDHVFISELNTRNSQGWLPKWIWD